MTITRVSPDELDRALDLIAGEQADISRGTTMLGEERDGVAAELADLSPDWGTTVRVARSGDDFLGASLLEHDEETGRGWVFGPWVVGGDEAWARWARPLLDAALDQLPGGIDRVELGGDVTNLRMAALAAEVGWEVSELSHVFAAKREAARSWPPVAASIRRATAADREEIRPLHDAEFPATYAPVERLLPDEPDEKFHVLVAEDPDQPGRFLGYAAGRVQPDGAGYLDYLAVSGAARGRGTGRDLVVAISTWLLETAPQHDVNLTVQDRRTPARRLYESLGFTLELSMVSYSRPKSR
ncbi:MAG: GNAT family N-acetyltransferase [Nocardioides sp.]